MARRGSLERTAYWQGLIADQEASGLSVSRFCRERGVPAGSFFNWRRKLAERQLAKPVAKFVPIAVSPFLGEGGGSAAQFGQDRQFVSATD